MGRPKGSSAGPGRPRATADTRLQYGRTSISFNLSELRVLNRTLRSPWWRSQLRLSGCCKCPVRGPRCLQVHHLMHFLASGNLDELLVALHHRLTALAGQLSAATAAAASAVSGVACGIGPGGGGGEVGADCDMCDTGECFDALHGGSLSSSNTPGPAVGKIITVGHHQQRQQVGAAGGSSRSKQRGRDQRGREQPAGQLEGGCGGGVVGLRRVAAEVCGALEELASQLPRGVLPLCPSDDLDFAQHKARGGADNREQQQQLQPVGAGPAPCGCGPAAPAPAATHGPAHVPAPPEGEAVEVKPELHHEQDMEPPHHHHHHHHHPYQQAVIPCHMHPQHSSYQQQQQQQQQQQHAPLQPPGQYGCAHHTITTEQLEPGQQQQQQAQYRAAGCTYHHPAFYPDIEQQQQQRQQQHMDCTPHATAQAQVAQQPAGASPPTASASQCDSTAAATPPPSSTSPADTFGPPPLWVPQAGPHLPTITSAVVPVAAPAAPPAPAAPHITASPPQPPVATRMWSPFDVAAGTHSQAHPLAPSPAVHHAYLGTPVGYQQHQQHQEQHPPYSWSQEQPRLHANSCSLPYPSPGNPAVYPEGAYKQPYPQPAPGQPHPYSGPPPPLLPPQPHPQPSPMLQHLRAQSPPPPPLLPPPSSPPPHLLHACSMSAPAHTAPTTALRATATHVLQIPPPHAASAAVVGHPVHPQPQPLPQQHQQHQHQQPQHQALDPSAAAAVAFYYELRASSPPLDCMDVAGQQQQQQQQQHHQPPPSFAAAPYSHPHAIRPTAHAGIEVDAPPPPQQQQQQHVGCVSGEAWPQEVMVWQAHVARVYEPGAEQVPTASAYVCAEPARLVAARMVD